MFNKKENEYKITKKISKPFKGETGEEIAYFWYTATRLSDNVVIQFGSMWGDYEEGETLELNLERRERRDGKIGWREVR